MSTHCWGVQLELRRGIQGIVLRGINPGFVLREFRALFPKKCASKCTFSASKNHMPTSLNWENLFDTNTLALLLIRPAVHIKSATSHCTELQSTFEELRKTKCFCFVLFVFAVSSLAPGTRIGLSAGFHQVPP